MLITRSNWETPNVVLAPAPHDREATIELYCHPGTLRQLADDLQNAKVGEYCGLVHGNVEEYVDGASVPGGTRGLMGAFALYRGIMRPWNMVDLGENVYVYLTDPPCTYSYPNRVRYRQSGVVRNEKPINAVFATYVDITDNFEQYNVKRDQLPAPSNVCGIVLFWEWVCTGADDTNLPANHGRRYLQHVW